MRVTRAIILFTGFAIVSPAAAFAVAAGGAAPSNGTSSERTANPVQSVVSTNIYNLLTARFNSLASFRKFSQFDNQIYLASAGDVSNIGLPHTPVGISLWINGGYNKISNDFAPTAYNGSTDTVALGGDYKLTSNLVVGLSGTYSRTALDTPFNQGGSKINGYAVMPYLQYTFNQWFNADLSGGYSWNSNNMHRIVGGTYVTGKQNTHGAIAVADLNAQTWAGSWLLSGKAGVLYSHDKRSNFVESNGTVDVGTTSNLTQGKFGGSVGYWMNGILPMVSLTYSYDFSRDPVVVPGGGTQPANDRSGLTVAIAINAYDAGGIKGLTVALNASKEFLRQQLSNKGLSLSVRYAY